MAQPTGWGVGLVLPDSGFWGCATLLLPAKQVPTRTTAMGRAVSSGAEGPAGTGATARPRQALPSRRGQRAREGFRETGSTVWSAAASAETSGVGEPSGWGLWGSGPRLAGQPSRRGACRELPTCGCAVHAPASSLEECRVTHWPANRGTHWAWKTKKPHARMFPA